MVEYLGAFQLSSWQEEKFLLKKREILDSKSIWKFIAGEIVQEFIIEDFENVSQISKIERWDKSQYQTEITALRKELKKAASKLSKVTTKLSDVKRKLSIVKSELNLRIKKTLSVHTERVHVQHLIDKKKWMLAKKSVLDTGNENICMISLPFSKAIGLTDTKRANLPKTDVSGVLLGKTEAWHITNIKLRIRDRKFKVLAAVGGETSVLVSEPDVLSPLFSEGYSIGLN
jgi:hypothetical protein